MLYCSASFTAHTWWSPNVGLESGNTVTIIWWDQSRIPLLFLRNGVYWLFYLLLVELSCSFLTWQKKHFGWKNHIEKTFFFPLLDPFKRPKRKTSHNLASIKKQQQQIKCVQGIRKSRISKSFFFRIVFINSVINSSILKNTG